MGLNNEPSRLLVYRINKLTFSCRFKDLLELLILEDKKEFR